jgi:hypothetical protein
MAVAPYQNADGLQVKFPTYYKDSGNFVNRARALNTRGVLKEIVFDYDLTKIPTGTISYTADLNNDGTIDGFCTGDVYLPAYSSVLRVSLLVTVAAAGGTSFTLGTYGLTGTAIAATGLITATEGVLANIDSIGGRTFGAGSLVASSVETASVGTADAYIGMATTGTFTAGKGRIVIEYLDPLGDV